MSENEINFRLTGAKLTVMTLIPPQQPTESAKIMAIFFHGYSGSPTDFNELPKFLETNLHIHTLVPFLPGHKTIPEDMLGLDYQDYLQFSTDLINSQAKLYDKIILFGFSLGSFLALESINHPKVVAAFLFHTPFKTKFPFFLPLFEQIALTKKFYVKPVYPEEKIWQANHQRYNKVPGRILKVINHARRATNQIETEKPVFFFESTSDRFINYRGSVRKANQLKQGQVITYAIESATHNPFYYPEDKSVHGGVLKNLKAILN